MKQGHTRQHTNHCHRSKSPPREPSHGLPVPRKGDASSRRQSCSQPEAAEPSTNPEILGLEDFLEEGVYLPSSEEGYLHAMELLFLHAHRQISILEEIQYKRRMVELHSTIDVKGTSFDTEQLEMQAKDARAALEVVASKVAEESKSYHSDVSKSPSSKVSYLIRRAKVVMRDAHEYAKGAAASVNEDLLVMQTMLDRVDNLGSIAEEIEKDGKTVSECIQKMADRKLRESRSVDMIRERWEIKTKDKDSKLEKRWDEMDRILLEKADDKCEELKQELRESMPGSGHRSDLVNVANWLLE